MSTIHTASESGHAAYVGDYLVGRVDNVAFAIDADGLLTVALIAPQSRARLTIQLCPKKLRAQRTRLPPAAPPPPPADPLVEAVCGLRVPPGRFHVFVFQGESCAT